MIGRNKYHNQKYSADGEVFDSKKEFQRWQELKILEKAGEISELRRQVPFELLPVQREPETLLTSEQQVYWKAQSVLPCTQAF